MSKPKRPYVVMDLKTGKIVDLGRRKATIVMDEYGIADWRRGSVESLKRSQKLQRAWLKLYRKARRKLLGRRGPFIRRDSHCYNLWSQRLRFLIFRFRGNWPRISSLAVAILLWFGADYLPGIAGVGALLLAGACVVFFIQGI